MKPFVDGRGKKQMLALRLKVTLYSKSLIQFVVWPIQICTILYWVWIRIIFWAMTIFVKTMGFLPTPNIVLFIHHHCTTKAYGIIRLALLSSYTLNEGVHFFTVYGMCRGCKNLFCAAVVNCNIAKRWSYFISWTNYFMFPPPSPLPCPLVLPFFQIHFLLLFCQLI